MELPLPGEPLSMELTKPGRKGWKAKDQLVDELSVYTVEQVQPIKNPSKRICCSQYFGTMRYNKQTRYTLLKLSSNYFIT